MDNKHYKLLIIKHNLEAKYSVRISWKKWCATFYNKNRFMIVLDTQSNIYSTKLQ
jgi:hypothetical protein